MESGQDAFDKSRLVMTFLTNLGVTWLLCSFRLVPKRKQVKRYGVIKIRILRKVFIKEFCFIRCIKQHIRAINQKRYNRFIFLENINSNSPKVMWATFLWSDRVFRFIRIRMFSSFKNPFASKTRLSELHSRCRRFILLVQTKEVVSMS